MNRAVILFNLGGPDKLDNVEPFLFNLFNDPAILNLPTFFRYPLAKLIANRRTPIAKKIYTELGGFSPILKLTKQQAQSLEIKLNKNDSSSDYKCFVVMRCWHPRAENVVKEVINYNPDEIILMPLYPQYSNATSGSSIREWHDVCLKNNFKVKTSTICCYPIDENFIQAHNDEITKKIKNLKNFKLIFSAHGLPEKNIKKGDPYQWQVEQSVDKIVKSLNIDDLDWVLSYQSRVGPLKWIGPSTENIIVENSKLGKNIVLVPVAFVSEHSETLVELDIEYKELADKNGCKNYTRVPALGTNENYIKAMTNLIINKQEHNFNGELFPPKIQCPNQFKKCPCLKYE
jgi:protoporphyrin/coproporphyrin ferrochelatase